MKTMLNFINSMFKSTPIQNKPKWRLLPDKDGNYSLQKWHPEVELYLTEVVRINVDEVDKYIERLERDVIYYRVYENENNT